MRLRAEALLGGQNRHRPSQAVVDDAKKRPTSASTPSLLVQGLAGLGLVTLDAALGTGVLDRHAVEGEVVRCSPASSGFR